MKFPIVTVPDFKKEVADEPKPSFYFDLSDKNKDEYDRNQVIQKSLYWGNKTAAASYNLCIVIGVFLFLTNGLKILQVVTDILHNYLGTKGP